MHGYTVLKVFNFIQVLPPFLPACSPYYYYNESINCLPSPPVTIMPESDDLCKFHNMHACV